MSETIPAIDVRVGQRVSAIHFKGDPVERIRRRFGRYPQATQADFHESGENGQPTVYLMLSDNNDGVYCLRPHDDKVTVEGGAA